MEQVQKQAPKIKNLLDSSNQVYQELLGYKLEQTSLQQIPESRWDEFVLARELNPNSSGIYLPRNQTAIIQEGNPLSLFHEYFGHGLYCEKSLQGRRLIDLEKKLLEEEKQEFQERRFIWENVQRFRQQSQTFQELDEFRKQNLAQYELFAIWTEHLLSGEHNLREDFERKYDSLSKENREAVDSITGFSKRFGNLATFYAQGIARRTTPGRIRRLLKDIYGDKIQDAKFALLYGSRKEFSDIDVFMVGKEIPRIRNGWIDIVTYSPKEFEEKRRFFDVEVTDPLCSGEIIFGDKNYFEEQRNKLIGQPIREEIIRHNLQEAETQQKLAYDFPEDSEWRKIGLSYALTFRLMAEKLRKGERLFTKRDLLHSKRASAEDDKPLQSQGGRKNAT